MKAFHCRPLEKTPSTFFAGVVGAEDTLLLAKKITDVAYVHDWGQKETLAGLMSTVDVCLTPGPNVNVPRDWEFISEMVRMKIISKCFSASHFFCRLQAPTLCFVFCEVA